MNKWPNTAEYVACKFAEELPFAYCKSDDIHAIHTHTHSLSLSLSLSPFHNPKLGMNGM
jgi:hypothetical protein